MEKSNFYFIGKAPPSKSLLNRALIIKSWFPNFKIQGESSCTDIAVMSEAIENLDRKKSFYCGLSGTAFRFLTVRMSRNNGDFLFTGEKALFKRPLEEAENLLAQLSAKAQKTEKGFFVSSKGWKAQGDAVYISSQTSSQYASALLLNSWLLDRGLYFSYSPNSLSYPYFKMTLDFVKNLGMQVQGLEKEFFIPKGQTLKKTSFSPEQDKSCLFALAGLASLKGQAVFLDWEENSLQPDNIFPNLLQSMGVSVERKDGRLIVSKALSLKPLKCSLKGAPDLFPILSILCAKAEGVSELKGTAGLAFKESNRLNKVKELLSRSGISVQLEKDKVSIQGRKTWPKTDPFVFDTAEDHRMAMAAEAAAAAGASIIIEGKKAVDKSFPEFYNLI